MGTTLIIMILIIVSLLLWGFKASRPKTKTNPDFEFKGNIHNVELKGNLVEITFDSGDFIYVDPKECPSQFQLVVDQFICKECEGDGRIEEFNCDKSGSPVSECCGGCYESVLCKVCYGNGIVDI